MGMLTQAYFQIYLSESVEGITASPASHHCFPDGGFYLTQLWHGVIYVSGPTYRQLYQLQFKTGGLHSSGLLLKEIRDLSHKPSYSWGNLQGQ